MNISQYANRIMIAAGLVILTIGATGQTFASLPTDVVYTAADSGPGSLRDAIANTPAGGTVYFVLASNSTIVLTGGSLMINKDLKLTLVGNPPAHNVTISGNDGDRVIFITAPVSVTLDGLTITRGRIKNPCDAGPIAGGGIYAVGGELTIVNSVITGNQASCLAAMLPVGDGGGIYTSGSLTIRNSRVENNLADGITGGVGGISAGEVLSISDSTFSGNVGDAAIRATGKTDIVRSTISGNIGVGIEASGPSVAIDATHIMNNTFWGILSGGVLTVTNSTISGNAGGGLYNYGRLALVNSTLSGNGSLAWSSSAFGGLQHSGAYALIASSTIVNNTSGNDLTRSGIVVNSGVVEMQNSIVASNGITNNFAISTSASLTSLGYNLTNSTDVLTATGDLTGTMPVLGPLENNGGPTPTHALMPGNPGIDAANPAGCTGVGGAVLASDQRGYPREADGDDDSVRRCDIGAYEVWIPTHMLYLPVLSN